MYSKKNSNKEIHLYTIAEGTGHINRMIPLAIFLKKYYKNLFVFFFNPNPNLKNTWIKNYLKKMNWNQKFPYKIFNNPSELDVFEEKTYYLIMDIRDHNPLKFTKFYKNAKVLCLDNYFNKKIKNYQYLQSLPSAKSKENIKRILSNFFINSTLLTLITKRKKTNEDSILFYLGIQKKQLKHPKKILKEINKQFNHKSLKNTFLIDPKNFYTSYQFYKILLRSKLVITYPGILLYESILLGKNVLIYPTESTIHKMILNQIKNDCKNYFIKEIKIVNLKFLYFNFKNFDKEIQYNLWTPYRKIKNWLKEYEEF
ncbi:MAG: hypothetical protein ACK4UJ_02555 [Leptonema sp. (in: bacteria)]